MTWIPLLQKRDVLVRRRSGNRWPESASAGSARQPEERPERLRMRRARLLVEQGR
jgi:hypothetical protein